MSHVDSYSQQKRFFAPKRFVKNREHKNRRTFFFEKVLVALLGTAVNSWMRNATTCISKLGQISGVDLFVYSP